MAMVAEPGLRPVRMGDTRVSVSKKDNGTIYIQSTETPDDYPRAITDKLDHWAQNTPDCLLLADRDKTGSWQKRSYLETRDEVRNLAQYLVQQDLSEDRPVLILSGNSLEHGLLALASMYAGIPYAPVPADMRDDLFSRAEAVRAAKLAEASVGAEKKFGTLTEHAHAA